MFVASMMPASEFGRVCSQGSISSWGIGGKAPTTFDLLESWLSLDLVDSLFERAEMCSFTTEGLLWRAAWLVKVEWMFKGKSSSFLASDKSPVEVVLEPVLDSIVPSINLHGVLFELEVFRDLIRVN